MTLSPRTRLTGSLVLILGALIGSPARAEEVVQLPDRPGKVELKLGNLSFVAKDMALGAGELAAVKGKLDQLMKAIRTHAIFNPVKGYEGVIRGELASPHECKETPCRTVRVAHQIAVRLGHYCKTAKGVSSKCGTLRGITFTANQPIKVGYAVDGELKDDQGRPMLKEPKLVKTFAGVPLYENNLMVLIRTKRPFFLPVTREQYLRARLRKLAQEEGADQPPLKMVRDKVQAELTRLTPAQRRSDAWAGDSPNLSGLTEPNAENSRRVVIHNPAFMDPRLPRTAIQLLTAEVTILYGGDAALERPLTLQDEHVSAGDIRMSEFVRTFDFQKLVALIDAR